MVEQQPQQQKKTYTANGGGGPPPSRTAAAAMEGTARVPGGRGRRGGNGSRNGARGGESAGRTTTPRSGRGGGGDDPGRGRGRDQHGRRSAGRGRGDGTGGGGRYGSGGGSGGIIGGREPRRAATAAATTLSAGRAPPLQRSVAAKPKNGDKGADAHTVSEGYRIRLTRSLMELQEDNSQTSLDFPPTLTNTERKFVHELSQKLGLKSKSHGKGDDRCIHVSKPKVKVRSLATTLNDNAKIPKLHVGNRGLEALRKHMIRFPPTETEALDSLETGSFLRAALVDLMTEHDDDDNNQDNSTDIMARLDELGLDDGSAPDPVERRRRDRYIDYKKRKEQHAKAQHDKQRHRSYSKMQQARSKLPALQHVDHIVQTVAMNPVTIISGDTGCGKSTQVPQFILDANPACSIAVTQPRRISAISIAERIAEEQCQSGVGGLIGYQVRLDSAVSNDTQLVFMTPGILLRKMQSNPRLNEYTHIVVDEIHERDKYQEFLVIVLRDLLPVRPDLRVILMSATLQTDSLLEYFTSYGQQPAVVEMEGRMFPVQEYFLENVLEMTGYIDGKTAYDGGAQFRLELEMAKLTGQEEKPQAQQQVSNVSMKCALCGQQNFSSAVELGEHIAVCTGFFDSDFDMNGATSSVTSALGVTAAETEYEEYDTTEDVELPCTTVKVFLASAPRDVIVTPSVSDTADKWDGKSLFAPESDPNLTSIQQDLLDKYQAMHDDETIDYYLLLEVVRYIVKSSFGDGGVLVFLPGWQDIAEFSRLLDNTAPFYDSSQFLILPLHSGIPSREQRRVLQPPPNGVRKIVLTTNIAETSLTVEDVTFVVDTGRAKEKNYEPFLKTSTLQPTWVSQASAKQRKGRAGRVKPGVCFHLFSSTRHKSLRQFTESELLRTPLEEMCLMCKQLGLAPGGPDDDDGIPAFLAKAMSAPHLKSVSNALELLVEIGAMHPETNRLTDLGECLAVLSLEPRVGKMILWSYLLGCARVASNMAVGMSYKSPFTLPRVTERQTADARKVEISKESESDQITVHNALESLELLNRDSAIEAYCRRNFLGASTMKMISELRRNLARELSTLGFPNPSTQNGFHNRHDTDQALWYAALAAGLYPNVAMRVKGDVNFVTIADRKVKVHVSSVNAIKGQPFSAKSKIREGDVEFVCFGEMVKGPQGTFTVDQTTRLPSALPLLLLCGTSLIVQPHPDDPLQAILSLDDWIVFKCQAETASNIVVLRRRLESAFWHCLSNPSSFVLTETEQDAVEIVGVLLQSTHVLNQCPI